MSTIQEARTWSCTAEEYHADYTAVSHSLLEEFIRSPERYQAIIEGRIARQETPAMRFGRLFHSAMEGKQILCPPPELADVPSEWEYRTADQVVMIPPECLNKNGDISGASNAWKTFRAQHQGKLFLKSSDFVRFDVFKEWQKITAGSLIATQAECAQVLAMKDSLLSQPWLAKRYEKGVREFTIRWTDDETGIACKARLDWLFVDEDGSALIIDWKSCGNASAEACAKSVHSYAYHRQEAFYVSAIWAYCDQIEFREDIGFVFAFCEKDPPYVCQLRDLGLYEQPSRVHQNGIAWRDAGQQQNDAALARLAECRTAGTFRRKDWDQVQTIHAPRWAKYESEWESNGDG